jgi:hypothetical protein
MNVVGEHPQHGVAVGIPECRLNMAARSDASTSESCCSGRMQRKVYKGLTDVATVDQTDRELNAALRQVCEGRLRFALDAIASKQTGIACIHSRRFIRAAAKHESFSCDGTNTVNTHIPGCRQRISVVLQRSNSESGLR